jgi:hypothetical protein
MRRLQIAMITALAILAAAPAAGRAAIDPSLTVDPAFAPPSGIAANDLSQGSGLRGSDEAPHAVAVSGNRIYSVGESWSSATNSFHIAVIAHRLDGTLDPGFAGDGTLTVSPVGNNQSDYANAIAVLPNGDIRIVGARDTDGSSSETDDVLIVGLHPDGSLDTTVGPGGTRTFEAAPSAGNAARAIAVTPDGGLAIIGSIGSGSDVTSSSAAFVALRDADGSPSSGFPPQVIDGASGADVALRPDDTIVAFLQRSGNAVLHAFTATGGDDTAFGPSGEVVLPVGGGPTTAGGLIAYGGQLYAAGSTAFGTNSYAFLARVSPDGHAIDARRFEMRGTVPATTSIATTGSDLDVIGGPTPALIVSGSILPGTSSSPWWAAAAFNAFTGPLAAAPMGSVVVQSAERQDATPEVAAGDGFAALAGKLTSSGSSPDASFGLAKLLLDADKSCDLGITIPSPLEVRFAGRTPAEVTFRVTNSGTKACGGTISVPSPYSLSQGAASGPIGTGIIAPGASFETSGALLHYGGTLKPEDLLSVGLSAPGDTDTSDNTAQVHVAFRYCDLELRVATMSAMPSEGSRRIPISVRNRGTTACRKIALSVGRGARRVDHGDRYTLAGGHSAADSIVIARHGGTVGHKLPVRVHVDTSSRDLRTSNDTVTRRPTLVRVGDTTIRAISSRAVAGVAARGRGHLSLRRLRVSRVDVAIRRLGVKGCRWVGRTSGALVSRPKRNRACSSEVWLRATGTTHWRLSLTRALAPGTYEVRSRATIRAGLQEARFGKADRNLRRLTVR